MSEAQTNCNAVYVHVTPGTYQARVRSYGCRKYQLVGEPTKKLKDALKMLADSFGGSGYKMADVLFVPDSGYYEPHVVCEMVMR